MTNPPIPLNISQKLIFVLGKGGVGRTSVATSLAQSFVQAGEKVLIVQWALQDSVGPRYNVAPCGHIAVQVIPNLMVMNFKVGEAMREYFQDHLGLTLLHKLVIENRHVQKLIYAAPGVQELFFLGRLFWLVFLQKQERGWQYDRIIVDSPATGHGVSLFSVAQTVASFGVAGPLVTECERVASMLQNSAVTGSLVVTLPEELPVEETLEFIPRLQKELKRPPLAVIVNRSVGNLFEKGLPHQLSSLPMKELMAHLHSEESRSGISLLLTDLEKRDRFEQIFRERIKKVTTSPVFDIEDVLLSEPFATPLNVLNSMANSFSKMAAIS